MSTKVALDVFTPIRDVFSVPADMVLTEANLVKIYAAGFARVPVYLPGDNPLAICGILMTRYLIVVNSASSTEVGRSVSTLPLRIPQCVPPDMALVDLLNLLQHGGRSASAGGHLALVCARPHVAMAALAKPGGCVPDDAGLMGIVTLEDVLEMLLQEVRAWFASYCYLLVYVDPYLIPRCLVSFFCLLIYNTSKSTTKWTSGSVRPTVWPRRPLSIGVVTYCDKKRGGSY
jgi:CBS domain containing-hemolysin-like protein